MNPPKPLQKIKFAGLLEKSLKKFKFPLDKLKNL